MARSIFYSRNFIKTAINSLLNRLKHGAGIKIDAFELDSLKVTRENDFKNLLFQFSDDINKQHANERLAIYKNQRFVMPVHKIFKSQKEGQLYDVLIYVIPHGNNSLIQVVSVNIPSVKVGGTKFSRPMTEAIVSLSLRQLMAHLFVLQK